MKRKNNTSRTARRKTSKSATDSRNTPKEIPLSSTFKDSEETEKNREEVEIIGMTLNCKLINEKEEKEEKEERKTEAAYKLNKALRNFTTILQMLWKYVNSIGFLAGATSNTSIGAILVLLDEIKLVAQQETKPPFAELEINIKARNKAGDEKNVIQKLDIHNPSHFQKIIEFKRDSEAALHILHDTAIQEWVQNKIVAV